MEDEDLATASGILTAIRESLHAVTLEIDGGRIIMRAVSEDGTRHVEVCEIGDEVAAARALAMKCGLEAY